MPNRQIARNEKEDTARTLVGSKKQLNAKTEQTNQDTN